MAESTVAVSVDGGKFAELECLLASEADFTHYVFGIVYAASY